MRNHNDVRTVTQGKWSVSVTTGGLIEGAVLNVTRHDRKTTKSYWGKGDADGRQFATSDEAWQYAYEHGYVVEYRPGAWCKHCRIQHTIGNKKTSFCAETGTFN